MIWLFRVWIKGEQLNVWSKCFLLLLPIATIHFEDNTLTSSMNVIFILHPIRLAIDYKLK